jgi:Uncharacterized protein conserved in cyanobacteria
MSNVHAHQLLSEDDYLQQEAAAAIRHEFVGGDAHAMGGASERHNRIAGNVFYHLRSATRGKPCRAFMANMKLRIAETTTYYYPDAMLVCEPSDDHPLYKHAPYLIAEVLSPATASVDLREKWLAYRELPSLRYYLVVDSERVWARAFFAPTAATGSSRNSRATTFSTCSARIAVWGWRWMTCTRTRACYLSDAVIFCLRLFFAA